MDRTIIVGDQAKEGMQKQVNGIIETCNKILNELDAPDTTKKYWELAGQCAIIEVDAGAVKQHMFDLL